MSIIPKSLYFVFLGTLPFILLSTAISSRLFGDGASEMQLTILLNYAVGIICFLGGVHMGIAIMQHEDNHIVRDLLIFQCLWPSILAWASLYTFQPHTQLLVLTLLFALLLGIDSLLFNHDLIPQWYYTLRCIITPIVVVSLYVAYFGII